MEAKMLSLICAGIKGVADVAKVVLRVPADAARAVSETAIAATTAPLAQAWAMAHKASGHMIMNGAGQMIQAPGAAAASSAGASAGLASLNVPAAGGSSLGSLAMPTAPMPGAAASAASAPQASSSAQMAPVTAQSMAGALPMQGLALPLAPQGVMRV